MRIKINVPDSAARISSSSNVDLSAMPAPLVRLAPSGELVLIELQGSLEIDDPHPDGGQVLAQLEFHPGREDNPTLLVSHHRLEGKLVTLTRPFAVLEKRRREDSSASSSSVMQAKDINRPDKAKCVHSFASSQSTTRTTPALIVDDEEEEDDDDDGDEPRSSQTTLTDRNNGAPDSPTLERKRARPDDMHGKSSNHSLALPSSSPVRVPPRMQGSEIDYSSPFPAVKRARQSDSAAAEGKKEDDDDDGEDEEIVEKRETAIMMDVVCIIRKKFLFTKRPEPVVRLDQDGGEQAKQALGLA